jgi:hypothetical protein
MMSKLMKKITITLSLIIILSLAQSLQAKDLFRYNYAKGDTLSYAISIISDLRFNELGNLAALLNIEKIMHNVEMDVDLIGKAVKSNGNFQIKVLFKRISMVMIAGDSVYVDNGENWGAIKPGSAYEIELTSRGRYVGVNSGDTVGARQVVQMVQRFFPVMPDKSIDPNYSWSDSVSFEVELPNQPPAMIFTNMTYDYTGSVVDNNQGHANFNYDATGNSNSEDQITLAGNGDLTFDNKRGRVVDNNGQFVLDAEVNLSMFGLPAGMGSTPVNIDSQIKIKLNHAR